ncbi:unknown [[Mannheimia] succiniciproducens MBEL55E]|uniref:Uncharacterized protein n=1 Tax=Mannheimia succiniciproducens (strain KCTC 0769BP / MBEL55E) TaxID=221988 RepID=Q65U73_MANSM|nr:unknown [[Mannheimia] succiniciproducens MBEL55E]
MKFADFSLCKFKCCIQNAIQRSRKEKRREFITKKCGQNLSFFMTALNLFYMRTTGRYFP